MATKITAQRGTEDILPPHSARWSELESRIRQIATCYGYGEIRTPTFEATELFVRSVGETTDIVEKEMYTFVDKGGRSITLKPEWTAPVVRAVLEHNVLVNGPQRFFYIGPVFRYERPQKGRLREPHQFGVECIGLKGPEADAEIIDLAWALVRTYGIHDATLRINSIGDEACRPRYREALLAHFGPHREKLSEDSQRRLDRNPLRILDSKDRADKPFIETAPTFESILCQACKEHFNAVKAYLDVLGIPYVVDSGIVRGLDYYTRTVFEITSSVLGAQSTVCGGGRYDGLIQSLGGPDTPAVGFGLGLERFLLMLDALHGETVTSRHGVQAIALGAEARTILFPLVAELRRTLKIPVFMDYEDRKLLAHLKIADRNNARWALLLGSDEMKSGEIVLRDLENRSDSRLPLGSAGDLTAALVERGM